MYEIDHVKVLKESLKGGRAEERQNEELFTCRKSWLAMACHTLLSLAILAENSGS